MTGGIFILKIATSQGKEEGNGKRSIFEIV